ncbi:MAG: hypothetical protein Kow00129_07620 [Thermoleophilia bacterium]
MKVRVKAFGNLASLLPPSGSSRVALEVEVAADSDVRGLVQQLDLPGEATRFVQVNGRRVELDHRLQEGDEVRFIVPLGGG